MLYNIDSSGLGGDYSKVSEKFPFQSITIFFVLSSFHLLVYLFYRRSWSTNEAQVFQKCCCTSTAYGYAYRYGCTRTNYTIYRLEKLGTRWVCSGYSMNMGLGKPGQKTKFLEFLRAPKQFFFAHFEKINEFRVFCNKKKHKQIRFKNITLIPLLCRWSFSNLIRRTASAIQLSFEDDSNG